MESDEKTFKTSALSSWIFWMNSAISIAPRTFIFSFELKFNPKDFSEAFLKYHQVPRNVFAMATHGDLIIEPSTKYHEKVFSGDQSTKKKQNQKRPTSDNGDESTK